MVLKLYVAIFTAVCTVDWISENIAVEPFSVIKSDIEGKFLLAALFSDSHMTDLLNLFSVEFFSWGDLSFICLKNVVSEVVVFWLGEVIVGAQSHVKIMLMCGPFDYQYGWFSDDINENLIHGMDEH